MENYLAGEREKKMAKHANKVKRLWFQGFTLHMNVYRFPGINFYYIPCPMLLIDQQRFTYLNSIFPFFILSSLLKKS